MKESEKEASTGLAMNADTSSIRPGLSVELENHRQAIESLRDLNARLVACESALEQRIARLEAELLRANTALNAIAETVASARRA